MAGTLVITTLSDGTNSTSSTNCIQGSAKAWVRFTGSTGTVASSYNVSSVTRTPNGLWTVAFTNAMTDANYCATAAVSTTSGTGSAIAYMFTNGSYTATAPTTTSFLIASVNLSTSYTDPVYVNVSVFGN
jgi:hypothetical protein